MTLSILLKCANLEETRAFYSEILEFKVSESAEETCTAHKAGGTLVFTEELWKGLPVAPERFTFSSRMSKITTRR